MVWVVVWRRFRWHVCCQTTVQSTVIYLNSLDKKIWRWRVDAMHSRANVAARQLEIIASYVHKQCFRAPPDSWLHLRSSPEPNYYFLCKLVPESYCHDFVNILGFVALSMRKSHRLDAIFAKLDAKSHPSDAIFASDVAIFASAPRCDFRIGSMRDCKGLLQILCV